MRTALLALPGILSLLSLACGSSGATSNPVPVSAPDAGTSDAAMEGSPDAVADAVQELAPMVLSFPQAIDGAMLVNPSVYDSVPLRIACSAPVDSLEVTLGGVAVPAVASDGGLAWTATLQTASLKDGIVAISARAMVGAQQAAMASVDLAVSRAGVQLTSYGADGPALCPRVHRLDGGLALTWSDRSDPTELSEAWVRRIDGAGRWIGEKIRLVGEPDDTLYARTAAGNAGIGVLYQKHGGPYRNKFLIADLQGNVLRPAVELDEPGELGSSGGDIVFDGAAFVIVWRVNDGAAAGKVKWARIPEDGGAMTGPVVIAEYAPLDPSTNPPDGAAGGMDPFTPIDIGLAGQQTIATFTRGRWSVLLEQELPKTQYAAVALDGTLGTVGFAGQAQSFSWDWAAHVFALDGALEIVRLMTDLNDSNPNHHLYYATHVDSTGAISPQGQGTMMLNPPGQLDDFFLIEHPEQRAVLSWLDLRTYETDPATGSIQLFVAPVGDGLEVGTPTVFEHARFIASTSELNGVLAGTNLVMTWLDERHGGGVLDPRPELWIDTAWY